jgi:hypothetical protein
MADDYDPWGINQTASDYGFDPQFLRQVIKVESGGNPNNRTGSYKGLLQLSDQEFNNNGGGNIYDPVDNLRAGARKLAAERDAFEAKYGRPPTPTDLYLIHQQGQGGYAQHMANPDFPAWQNMANTGEGRQKGENWARRAIWGNVPDQLKQQYGSVDDLSSAEFVDLWRKKIEGDIPYIDARASGSPAGLPFQAGGLGAEPASGSPAGMPVQAADDFSAIASMRGPRMANRQDMGADPAMVAQQQAPGLLASLVGQQQGGGQGGIGGLLGALNPEKMAYLAMIAKGLNPYTDVDPTKMLALAQSSRENALKLAQQQREHELDRNVRLGQQGINLSAEKRAQADYDRQRADEAEQLKEYRRINAPDAGAPGAEGSFGATEAPLPDDTQGAPGAIGARGAVDAASQFTPTPQPAPAVAQAPAPVAAPESAPARMQKIQDYLNRFPNSKFSPMLEREKERLLAQEEARGKLGREAAEREKIADKMGLTGQSRDAYITGMAGLNRPALTATDRQAIYKAEDALPAIQGTKEALERALEINPQVMTGWGAGLAGELSANLGITAAEKAKGAATVEWGRIMSREAITQMSQNLKGATTDFELRKFEDILGNPKTPVDVRKRTIERMLKLSERQETLARDRVNELRGGDYFKPGGGASKPGGIGAPSGGGAGLLDEARQAIKNGAPRDAVIQRLRQMGGDPAGL